MKIEILNSKVNFEAFYLKVAPFICNADLGIDVKTKDTYDWFVAFDESDNVIGFCALEIKKDRAHLLHGYVVPERRNEGVYKLLFNARKNYIKRTPSIKTAYAVFSIDGYKSIKKIKHRVVKEYTKFKKVEFDL